MTDKFFIYSLPFSDSFVLIANEKSAESQVEMVTFKKNEKFTFHSGETQILKSDELLNLNINPFLNDPVIRENYLSKEQYAYRIGELQNEMQKSDTEKVVFSRIKKFEGRVNLIQSLINLRMARPDAFCYLMHHDEVETWIGASPELLLSETEDAYRTVSLAGTIPADEKWTDKELEEQKMVTDYISSLLENNNLSFEVSGIQESSQGIFKHLKQEISIEKDKLEFSDLLKILNPTPAVCGLPKDKAEKLIRQLELHDREFYTGYINIWNSGNQKAYVNIRCAKIFKDYADIYVGGGITAQSNPNKEWRETEMKASIIENSLSLYQ